MKKKGKNQRGREVKDLSTSYDDNLKAERNAQTFFDELSTCEVISMEVFVKFPTGARTTNFDLNKIVRLVSDFNKEYQRGATTREVQNLYFDKSVTDTSLTTDTILDTLKKHPKLIAVDGQNWNLGNTFAWILKSYVSVKGNVASINFPAPKGVAT